MIIITIIIAIIIKIMYHISEPFDPRIPNDESFWVLASRYILRNKEIEITVFDVVWSAVQKNARNGATISASKFSKMRI